MHTGAFPSGLRTKACCHCLVVAVANHPVVAIELMVQYLGVRSSASIPSFTLDPGEWNRSVNKRHFPILCPFRITLNRFMWRECSTGREKGPSIRPRTHFFEVVGSNIRVLKGQQHVAGGRAECGGVGKAYLETLSDALQQQAYECPVRMVLQQ